MTTILILYASQTGNTERMAQAAAEGVSQIENARAILKRAPEAGTEDLLAADGLLIGTPENFGYMAGLVKDFFDRTYPAAQEQVFRKPYAVFISAGNDGEGALRAVERIALGYKLRKVGTPVIARGALTESILQACRDLGGTLAGGCALGIY